MKKILATVISLVMCGAMFTACGSDTETADATETTTTTVAAEAETEATEAETEATEAETEATEAETEATEAETEATEAETEATEAGNAAAAGSYADLKAFVDSGDGFNFETTNVAAKDSLTYNWVKVFDGAESIYLDVEAIDGSMTMIMGMKEDKIFMDMYEQASDTKMAMLFRDGKMYMLDEATKTGYYMAADESMMEEYNIEEMLGDIDFDAETENAGDVKVATVEIGGEEYKYELAETGGGFLYSKDEKLFAILTDEDEGLSALKINEFSAEAPDSVFELPSDYQMIDMDAMLAATE